VIDLLYLAYERPEFTRASIAALIANTNWSLVNRVVVYDDAAKDDFPFIPKWPGQDVYRCQHFGGPVAIMNDYLARDGADVFAKIDNDVIVPLGWLDTCVGAMARRPELGLLGIEPPKSRTPAPWANGVRMPAPELTGGNGDYARCDMIGGIGLMRRSAFASVDRMRPFGFNGVGGFSDWQARHPEVVKGWIVPPLDLFLLDRLPIEPWASLSREYIAKGWQRPWTNYDPADAELWNWWEGAKQ
jgi:hypothetical protein